MQTKGLLAGVTMDTAVTGHTDINAACFEFLFFVTLLEVGLAVQLARYEVMKGEFGLAAAKRTGAVSVFSHLSARYPET